MSRKYIKFLVPLLSLSCVAMSANAAGDKVPHIVTAADQAAIASLLASYTNAVTTGNEAAFSRLLLNENIPFFCTDLLAKPSTTSESLDVRQYQGFRDAVFRSHPSLTQRFSNVHIEQDGDLAAVSLDFVTLETGTTHGSYGFKTLQLIKVAGTWKIASEFYSAYALEQGGASKP
jgi:hypothetical protein